MKKLLIMVSMLAMGVANLNVLHLVNGLNAIKAEDQEESIFEPLNWKEIRTTINQVYSRFLINKTYSDDEQEMLKQAKVKTFEYLNKFESRDSSYEEVIIETKNEHEGFKETYEENWDNNLGMWISYIEEKNEWQGGPKGNWLEDWMGGYKGKWLGSSGTSWTQPPIKEWKEPLPDDLPDKIRDGEPIFIKTTNEDKKKLVEKLNQIDILGRTCSTLSVAAGLVAAGFWALAWAGGISIPWAVAASTVSATLGILGPLITLNVELISDEIQQVKFNPWKKMIQSATTVIISFKVALLVTSITSATIITATSWAVPFVLAILGIIIEIGSWIYWVNPNIIDLGDFSFLEY